MDYIAMARQLRQMIVQMAQQLDDEHAMEVPYAFPKWKDNTSYEVGDRIRYGEKLYKVLQAHTSQAGWNPADATSLFAEILPGQDGTDIGEWTQPDSTNPYMKGDRVRFNGHIYESLIDNNIWSPEAYPAGWQLIE